MFINSKIYVSPYIKSDMFIVKEEVTKINKNYSISDVLIPNDVFLDLNNMKDARDREHMMVMTAKLIVALIRNVKTALDSSDYEKFDGNAGDFGCEKQAVTIYDIVKSIAIHDEFKELEEQMKKVSTLILARDGKLPERLGNPLDFFDTVFKEISVSNEAAYLIRAFLLTVTKQEVGKGCDTHFETDIALIKNLVPKINAYDTIHMRKKVVYEAQKQISISSIFSLREKVIGLTHIDEMAKKHLVNMFSQESIKECTKQIDQTKSKWTTKNPFKGTVTKFFSNCFHNVWAVLEVAKENQIPIVLKRWILGKEDKPLVLLLQSQKPGSSFDFISENERKKLEIRSPAIVMRSRISNEFDASSLREKIKTIGFQTLILSNVSQLHPFDPGSKIEDIKSEEARNEIREYQKIAEKIDCIKEKDPFFFVDHIYCSSIQKEFDNAKEGVNHDSGKKIV